MSKKRTAAIKTKHVSLILVEGDTELEFYKLIAASFLNRTNRKIENLHGNFNIHKKILDKAKRFSDSYANDTFDVYVCIDQDRIGTPALNEKYLLNELKRIRGFNVLNTVIAVLMIESIFFIDIDGIYKFLRAETKRRNPKKYSQYRKLTCRDLSKLFRQFRCVYHKGARCNGLVNSLNIEKISNTADEIKEFIKSYNSK